jgi:hypothetical protein
LASPEWKDLQFLPGEWDATGSGEPGQGIGSVSFTFELGNKILVRRNHLEFAATKNTPAFAHDDQLITYKEENGEMRAIYFDNEGHTIHYEVSISPEGNIVYSSNKVQGTPRFRMSYIRDGDGVYSTRFEIAPPDDPDRSIVHVEGPATKK